MQNPIVEEVRRAREEHAASFNYLDSWLAHGFSDARKV